MPNISESVCLNHPNTPAATRCAACGKPICESCIVNEKGSNFCSNECAKNASTAVKHVDYILEKKKKTEGKAKRRKLLTFFIILIIAVLAYYFYSQNKDEVHGFFKKAEQKIEKTTKDSKEAIQKNVPKSSSYKRQTEGLID